MKRIEAIKAVAMENTRSLIVCNLGYPARELFHVADRAENFYMLGSMGLASSIGLGLALSCKNQKVIAIDGDGSILMNLGSLSTIASQAPDNYLLIIMDNGVYGSTGGQPSATSGKTNLSEVAKGAGIGIVKEAFSIQQLGERTRNMPAGVLIAKVEGGNADVPLIDLQPREILERFMRAARASPSS
jgi:sulfopyruvate decarboxylase subunit beta